MRPPHRFPRDAAQPIRPLRPCLVVDTNPQMLLQIFNASGGPPVFGQNIECSEACFERGYRSLRRARWASSTGRTSCRRPLREYCEVRAHLMSSEPGAAFPAASHSRRSWAADSAKAEASRSSYRVATIRPDPTLPRSPLRSATRIDGGQGCYRQESVTLRHKEGSTCRSWLRTSAENFR